MKEVGEGKRETTLSKRITIDDLRGKLIHMEVMKKKGMEKEKLLIPADEAGHSTSKKVSSYDLYLSVFSCVITGFKLEIF